MLESNEHTEIKVLIADDHELVRCGLRTVLETEDDIIVVGEATNGSEAIERTRELEPDLLLLDLHMPNVDGVEACERICSEAPGTKILVLTSYDGDEEVFGALSAGASSFIMKDVEPQALVETIRGVARGKTILDSAIADRVIAVRQSESTAETPAHETLSEREIEVLSLMAKGMKNKEIAQALWIGETTVKTHVSHILQKLGQSDRTKAILTAIRKGLISVPTED